MENHYIPQIKASREKLEAAVEQMNKLDTETRNLMAELSEEMARVEAVAMEEAN